MTSSHPAARLILHVDMDCFFAAVEERENPALRGKPVIVGADPKGGSGRGIVATCNYEARRFGVRSAMPISQAYRRCPRAMFLRPNFSLYVQASRRVMELLRPAADAFEPAGLDEAYLDVSSLGTFEAARAAASRLRAAVREREGLSCSVGVGPNKLIAKIASDHRKPGGLTVVIPSRVQEFLDPKDVGVLRGVGPKTREHLLRLGVEKVRRLRELSEAALTREFGKFGGYLWKQARGLDERPVEPHWEAKSIGREVTFERDRGDMEEVRGVLLECVADVHKEMIQEAHWARTFTVKLRYEGYETHSRQTTLRLPTGRLEAMRAAALGLIEPFLTGRRVRLVGFSAAKFSPPEELLLDV